ncbi:MAG: hypothetical protein AVDCRST_MAG60-421, partial [uncultured Nocardioides sp.]
VAPQASAQTHACGGVSAYAAGRSHGDAGGRPTATARGDGPPGEATVPTRPDPAVPPPPRRPPQAGGAHGARAGGRGGSGRPPGARGGPRPPHGAGRPVDPRLGQRPRRSRPRRAARTGRQADRPGTARPGHRVVHRRVCVPARRAPVGELRPARRRRLPHRPAHRAGRQPVPARQRAVLPPLGAELRALPRLHLLRRVERRALADSAHRHGDGAGSAARPRRTRAARPAGAGPRQPRRPALAAAAAGSQDGRHPPAGDRGDLHGRHRCGARHHGTGARSEL